MRKLPILKRVGCIKAVSYTHLDVYKRQVKDSFKINMSDKDAPNLNSIINLYRLELDIPFALQQFDSLLAIRLDEQRFTTHLVVSEDSTYQWNAELKRQGTLFNPYIEVSYPYNPLKHQLLLVTVKVSPHAVLVRMGWQLFLSLIHI